MNFWATYYHKTKTKNATEMNISGAVVRLRQYLEIW